MRIRNVLGMMALAVLLAVAGCGSGQEDFTLSLGSDYETARLAGMYAPDPNGGVGVMVVTDSVIPRATSENFAVGPVVNF
ncbi:MAG: hypothetical protein MUC88_27115, partial [Planctomycetes bacterium]|nr:hypothetical protein [Planctomycetota bacterium]